MSDLSQLPDVLQSYYLINEFRKDSKNEIYSSFPSFDTNTFLNQDNTLITPDTAEKYRNILMGGTTDSVINYAAFGDQNLFANQSQMPMQAITQQDIDFTRIPEEKAAVNEEITKVTQLPPGLRRKQLKENHRAEQKQLDQQYKAEKKRLEEEYKAQKKAIKNAAEKRELEREYQARKKELKNAARAERKQLDEQYKADRKEIEHND